MSRKNVLVVGDVMVDEYVKVYQTRRAPEAPIPVWDEIGSMESRAGGAANVLKNIRAIGGEQFDVSLVGLADFADFRFMADLLQFDGNSQFYCSGTQTMRKRRFVNPAGEYVFRHDNIKKFKQEDTESLCGWLEKILPKDHFDAVVFSDYDKGSIDNNIVRIVRERNPKAFTVVDSKRADLSLYSGMDVLKINEHEYAVQVASDKYVSVESLFKSVIVTKGQKGASLIQFERGSRPSEYKLNEEKFPTQAVPPVDVTGCGDTHTSALVVSMLMTKDLRASIKFANRCATDVVQKFGTSLSSVSFAQPAV